MPDKKTVFAFSIDNLSSKICSEIEFDRGDLYLSGICRILQPSPIFSDSRDLHHAFIHYTIGPEQDFHHNRILGKGNLIEIHTTFESAELAMTCLTDMVEYYLGIKGKTLFQYDAPYTILTTPERIDPVIDLLSNYPEFLVKNILLYQKA